METFLGRDVPDHTPDFRGVMIDRAAFDAALVEEARAAGATILCGTAFHGLHFGLAHLGHDMRIAVEVVVGADGPRSTVGRLAGMENRDLVEARQVTVPLLHPHDATDIFLSAQIMGGYGWLFPRGTEANLGLGVAPQARGRLKALLDDLRQTLVAQGRIGPAQTRLTGGAIPVGGICGLSGELSGVPVLLAGDAAGLANPITGAGINAAVLSGQMAGATAAAMVAGSPTAAEDYAEEVSDLFGPSLTLARQRRVELLDHYARGQTPDTAALRRSWIAYGDYWRRDTITTPVQTEAKEPA